MKNFFLWFIVPVTLICLLFGHFIHKMNREYVDEMREEMKIENASPAMWTPGDKTDAFYFSKIWSPAEPRIEDTEYGWKVTRQKDDVLKFEGVPVVNDDPTKDLTFQLIDIHAPVEKK